MLRDNTLFILGAGAHCSYGFPSGKQLKNDIIEVIEKSLSSSGDEDFLLMATYGAAPSEDVQRQNCRSFLNALSNSGQPSIDAFINANRHMVGFETIGKGAIAQVLLKYEKKHEDKKDDWLQYLFEEMIDGVSSLENFSDKRSVSFITFNYDRFLEIWLYTKIKNSYGCSHEEALAALKKIEIKHVYGELGSFPIVETKSGLDWVHASKGIRTIYDTSLDVGVIESSKDMLRNANSICLLGFGFHRENIELLELSTNFSMCDGHIYASRFGITDAERIRYEQRVDSAKNMSWSLEGEKCLQALRRFPLFV